MTTEFTNEYHEVLFALFVLEANHLFARNIIHENEETLIHKVCLMYFNSWEDRAICPESFTGEVFKVRNFPFEEYKEHFVKSEYGSPFNTGKITFQFEEE